MIQTKVKIIKQLYPKGASTQVFRIFACELMQKNSDIKLNKWGNFTLKGNLSFLIPGQIYDLSLEEMKEDPKYGTAYTTAEVPYIDVTNMTLEAQHQLLETIASPNIVKSIIAAYPDFVQLILDEKDDEIDLSKIHNVGPGRFETYKKAILGSYKIFAIQSQLATWEVDTEETERLVSLFQTVDRINEEFKKNPYSVYLDYLMRPYFKKTDDFIIAMMPEFTETAIRAEYYIQYILRANERDGHSYLDANTMLTYLPKTLWQFAVDLVKNNPRFSYDKETKTVALSRTFKQELFIAQKLMLLFYASYSFDIDTKKYKTSKKYKLTDNQHALLDMVNQYNVCTLVGYAGTGKTTTLGALTEMLKDNGISFTLLAPTGIAAKRLEEATGFHAHTIHSQCMNSIPFTQEVIIVDELSMANLETFYLVCQKLEKFHKLVLIGDTAQLPAIGVGNVLQDIIDSKMLPYVNLSKVFRFGIGGIATVTTNIRKGAPYLDQEGNLLFDMKDADYKFIPVNDDPMEQILDAYKELLEHYSYKDILILCPFNKGDYGTRLINNKIQAKYNPPDEGQPLAGYAVGYAVYTNFNVGDKVIHVIKNDYNALTKEEYEYELDIQKKAADDLLPANFERRTFSPTTVVNGDIGYVEKVLEDKVVYVKYSHATIVYTAATLKRLMLAQSVSIHKCQGAESKAVILFTHPSHQHMLNRNLLYTATSRAKEVLIQIGDPMLINQAIDEDASKTRNTWLARLLQKEDIIDDEAFDLD